MVDGVILNDIKKLLNIDSEDTSFDTDVIIHINTVFDILNQLGVGPSDGFEISTGTERWSEYISMSNKLVNNIKTYIYLKIKPYFDPTASSVVQQAEANCCNELEWRIREQNDNTYESEDV